jgi:FkbM family methyltransferase
VTDKVVSFRPFAGRSFTVAGDDHDIGVVGEIDRSGGEYQRELTPFLRRRLPDDAIAIDGGAHIGVLSLLLASVCTSGHVYAFEPVSESNTYLQRNLAVNGVTNVSVERAALYDTDTEVALDANAAQPGGAHIASSGARVPAVRLDTWVAAHALGRLDLLKLDVEGAEIAVLTAASETIRRFRPIAVVECNPVALRRFGHRTYRELFMTMQSLFGAVAVLGPNGRVVPLLSTHHLQLVLGQRGVVDLVGLPDSHEATGLSARAWSLLDVTRSTVIANRWHATENKIVDADIRIAPGTAEVSGPPASTVRLPIRIVNDTRWWLSSSFVYHPVHVSYRVFDDSGTTVVAEGHRSDFATPVRPHGWGDVDLTVELPPVAGHYELVVTLVQEAFAWLDDLDPKCTARVGMRVIAPQ